MAPFARALCLALALAIATPADALPKLRRKAAEAPPDLPPAEAAIWPYPAPDPKTWWDDDRPKPDEAADPLGGRKLGARERLTAVDNGIEPTVYRLWGVQPLQTQVLRGEEMILEVWARPARSVRQTVIRVTVRRDGDAFVQARAGLACCEADIARRVGFDAKLPAGSGAAFLALRAHPMWDAPRDVRVSETGASDAVCVDGTSYDLTLMVPGRSRSLRRACDLAEIGQVADALEPALNAALGHEPRIDVLFADRGAFATARGAYQSLLAEGGTLKAAPQARPQPPSFVPEAEGSDAAATVSPER